MTSNPASLRSRLARQIMPQSWGQRQTDVLFGRFLSRGCQNLRINNVTKIHHHSRRSLGSIFKVKLFFFQANLIIGSLASLCIVHAELLLLKKPMLFLVKLICKSSSSGSEELVCTISKCKCFANIRFIPGSQIPNSILTGVVL